MLSFRISRYESFEKGLPTVKSLFPFLTVILVLLVGLRPVEAQPQDSITELEHLANLDPKPFVLVEATVEDSVAKAQGVIVSSQGHVLSVGHVTFVSPDKGYSNHFRVSLRGKIANFPEGFIHMHKTVFADREGAEFAESFYDAELVTKNDSRFVEQTDLSMFKMSATGALPKIDFYAQQKPKVELGETFFLCHYNAPHANADPTFLINPVKVVGVTQTTSGLQYLAEGYYRVGSSGGAILKNGRLIGIQSAAYTVNAKNLGEIPANLISFHLVWEDLIGDQIGHQKLNSTNPDSASLPSRGREAAEQDQ